MCLSQCSKHDFYGPSGQKALKLLVKLFLVTTTLSNFVVILPCKMDDVSFIFSLYF